MKIYIKGYMLTLALALVMVLVFPYVSELMNVLQFTIWMIVQVVLILYSVSKIAKIYKCEVET